MLGGCIRRYEGAISQSQHRRRLQSSFGFWLLAFFAFCGVLVIGFGPMCWNWLTLTGYLGGLKMFLLDLKYWTDLGAGASCESRHHIATRLACSYTHTHIQPLVLMHHNIVYIHSTINQSFCF